MTKLLSTGSMPACTCATPGHVRQTLCYMSFLCSRLNSLQASQSGGGGDAGPPAGGGGGSDAAGGAGGQGAVSGNADILATVGEALCVLCVLSNMYSA